MKRLRLNCCEHSRGSAGWGQAGGLGHQCPRPTQAVQASSKKGMFALGILVKTANCAAADVSKFQVQIVMKDACLTVLWTGLMLSAVNVHC